MGDFESLVKNLFNILIVGTAPLYELVLLMYVQPPPLNYVAAALPPAGLAAYALYLERKREKLFFKQLKSTWTYNMEKSVKEYTELIKNQKEKKKKS
jgi:hypothetical protein